LHSRIAAIKGKEFMIEERCQMGPVQSHNDNQVLFRWPHGRPPARVVSIRFLK
jgi:hypothetical protein